MGKFKVGMMVRVRKNISINEKMISEISWVSPMDLLMGKKGKIVSIDSDEHCVRLDIGWWWHLSWLERPCRLKELRQWKEKGRERCELKSE